MIEAISERISNRLYTLNEKQNVSPAVMKFALISLLTNVISIVLIMVIGLLIGHLADVSMSLLAIAFLRFLTGGYHIKSAIGCIVVSVGVVIAIPFIPLSATATIALTVAAIILVLIYAPSRLRGKTRVSEKWLQIRKWIAIAAIALNLYFLSDILALVYFVQAVSLIHRKGG